MKGVSLSNSGHISLAPKLVERLDAGASHLWSAVAGSGGRVYAGGSDGKVYVLDASGKSRIMATLEGSGTVYALAAQGEEVYAASSPDAKIWRSRHGRSRTDSADRFEGQSDGPVRCRRDACTFARGG